MFWKYYILFFFSTDRSHRWPAINSFLLLYSKEECRSSFIVLPNFPIFEMLFKIIFYYIFRIIIIYFRVSSDIICFFFQAYYSIINSKSEKVIQLEEYKRDPVARNMMLSLLIQIGDSITLASPSFKTKRDRDFPFIATSKW